MAEQYHSWLSLFLVMAAYLGSLWAVKRKRMTVLQHRKLWNYLLLISFTLAGLSGMLLALTIDSGIRLPAYVTFLFLHVESGLVMTVVAAIHVLWHWRYFKL